MIISKGVLAVALIGMCPDIVGAQSAATTSDTAHPLDLYAKPQRLVTLLNGRRMNILCTGAGSPTVLLEAGWGDNNWIWAPVQRRVTQTNRVCSYDRAGLGFSDSAKEPRTPANIATDLASLLKGADIKGPYVIVGHSAGGMHARAFTDMHRKEIVGMLLVDPVGMNQHKRFEAEIPAGAQRHAESKSHLEKCVEAATSGALQKPSLPDTLKSCLYMPRSPSFPAAFNDACKRIQESPGYFRTLLSEDMEESATNVASAPGSYGDLPLIVLTASNSGDDSSSSLEESAKFKKIWSSMHEEIAALSTRGIHRQVPDASHFVIIEKPDVIAAAISEVISTAAN